MGNASSAVGFWEQRGVPSFLKPLVLWLSIRGLAAAGIAIIGSGLPVWLGYLNLDAAAIGIRAALLSPGSMFLIVFALYVVLLLDGFAILRGRIGLQTAAGGSTNDEADRLCCR